LKSASTDASIDPIAEENMLADDRGLLCMVDAVPVISAPHQCEIGV